MLATPNFCAKAVDVLFAVGVIYESTLSIAAVISHVRAIASIFFVKAFVVRTMTDINFKFINAIVFITIEFCQIVSKIHDKKNCTDLPCAAEVNF